MAEALTPLPPDRANHLYAAGYCEENVWHLAEDARLGAGARHVVFLSGSGGSLCMWRQRAAPLGDPIVWDYHVVLLVGSQVYDFDTTLSFPVPVAEYLHESFPAWVPVAAPLRPRFRVLPAEDFRAIFASDRSHMRDAPVPPPPWPCIRTPREAMNLARFTDLTRPGPGEVMDLAGFAARFA